MEPRSELTLLARALPSERVKFLEPMSRHTSFRIGGPAEAMVFPQTLEELRTVLALVRTQGWPLLVVGRGTNLLVRDGGIRGVVVKLEQGATTAVWHGRLVRAQAGLSLAGLAREACSRGLGGLEFAGGIPGTLGGGVFMNAGAYGGELAQCVREVVAVDMGGELHLLSADACRFGYRYSVFQEGGFIIWEVLLELEEGKEAAELVARLAELNQRRREKQPLELPSAGSVFKRPVGYYAGTLIDQAGLRGLRIGEAQVSERHANFIVNLGRATARDVLALIAEVQARVLATAGVKLEPEVRVVGEDA